MKQINDVLHISLDNFISIVKANDSSIHVIEGDYDAMCSYYISNRIFQKLESEGVINGIKDFFFWCEIQDDMKYKNINGETIVSINNCFKHILLSKRKISGLFCIYIPENVGKNIDAIKNMFFQIKGAMCNNTFILLSNAKTVEILISESPYCKVYDYNDYYIEMLGPIWKKLNKKNKNFIIEIKGEIIGAEIFQYINEEIYNDPNKDVNILFDLLMERRIKRVNKIGF